MHRNQYLFSKKKIEKIPENFRESKFEDWFLYTEENLNFILSSGSSGKVLVIGFIFQPLKPESSQQENADELALELRNFEKFLFRLQDFSGRFVIIASHSEELYVIPDACGLRRIFYNSNDNIVTSSEELYLDWFGLTADISDEKREFIDSKRFEYEQNTWVGDDGYHSLNKRVLPNHILKLTNFEVSRRKLKHPVMKSEKDVFIYAEKILRGSFKAALNEYQLIQPITAGMDSRIQLAASTPFKDKINYYIFNFGLSPDYKDFVIPGKISKKIGLNFEVIDTEPFTDEFLAAYKKEHIKPRLLSKIQSIQYHYYHNRDKKVLNINGNCTEVVRTNYGLVKPHTGKIVTDIMRYWDFKYPRKKLDEWVESVIPFSKENHFPVADLLYWEQGIGNGHALYPYEQDIAIEEFSPFNNYNLLLAFNQTSLTRRKLPHFDLFLDFIRYMDESVLCEPVNPVPRKVKKQMVEVARGVIKSQPILASIYFRLLKYFDKV